MLRIVYGTDISDGPNNYCQTLSCLGEPWCSAWGICSSLEASEEGSGFPLMEQEQEAGTSGYRYGCNQACGDDGGSEQEYDQIFLELSQQLATEEQV